MPTDNPDTPSDEFRMVVDDTFMINGRGLVVTGTVESGTIRIGQTVQVSSPDGLEVYETRVKGIEGHLYSIGSEIIQKSDSNNLALLLPDLTKEQVKVGMLITLAN
jgi:selenocysteine-specific elongation factor